MSRADRKRADFSSWNSVGEKGRKETAGYELKRTSLGRYNNWYAASKTACALYYALSEGEVRGSFVTRGKKDRVNSGESQPAARFSLCKRRCRKPPRGETRVISPFGSLTKSN